MNELLGKISKYVGNNSFDEDELDVMMDECVIAFEEQNCGIQVVQEILELMEQNPFVEFGSPGALVHFAETFSGKGYEELVYKSVERKPTVHTLWMLNRIINAESDNRYINLLKIVSERQDIEDDIRNIAIEFYEYQNNK